jgi:hypothetical protein
MASKLPWAIFIVRQNGLSTMSGVACSDEVAKYVIRQLEAHDKNNNGSVVDYAIFYDSADRMARNICP